MADCYQVLTESLTKHAGTIDRIAGQVAQAAAAGHQMGLPSGAYGMLCMDLPAMLNPLQEQGAVALATCAKRLDTAAARIRATARDYATADEANDLALRRAGHATGVR
jgi:hypothetical protein